MTGETRRQNGKTRYYYSCEHHHRTRTCAPHRVTKDEVEKTVVGAVQSLLFGEDTVDILARRVYESTLEQTDIKKVADLRAEESATEKKIDNLYKAIEAGLDITETTKRISALNIRKNDIHAEIIKLQFSDASRGMTYEETRAWLANLSDVAKLSPEQQKAVLYKFLNRVDLFETPDGFKLRIVIAPEGTDYSSLDLNGADKGT